MRLTVFDCEDDEASVFRSLSPRFHIEADITRLPVRQYSIQRNLHSSCISVGHKSRITASDLEALRTAGVSCIITRSIGTDHIDTDAAARLGITIQNTPYAPDGVAEYTVMLILMAIRGIRPVLLRTAQNDWRLNAGRGKELRDMTAGIIGAGRIGRAVAQRLSSFGCRILLCDAGDKTDCIPMCDLLRESDIVTLHAPLTVETYHMIGRQQLHLVKRGALLINTARGALIDTAELICALKDGRIGGAALDVLEEEEGIFYSDHPPKAACHPFLAELCALPNVLITPHTAYYTDRVLYDTVEKTLADCLNFERRQNHE